MAELFDAFVLWNITPEGRFWGTVFSYAAVLLWWVWASYFWFGRPIKKSDWLTKHQAKFEADSAALEREMASKRRALLGGTR